ncbi:cystathionine beta-lyase [Bacillus pakistanensis]|uniref:cysteine-S-conjugate beta-lyase n=1 Tax=Rossellomorea pakistanensis TaxID=992288 RepID=A0ABS2NEJ3_9BACI|nr:MalY/PatB family protein [Bacillus pakistanensis]MBM7586257.1 cystathionine beta-lyase [Bacillus pakistanensis]
MNDFHYEIKREGTNSVKWDLRKTIFGKEDVLPMWVADMDFAPPPMVIKELEKRLEHGIFGYTFIGERTASSIQNWLHTRHNWSIETDSLLYSPGVVPAIATIIQAHTQPNDRIMLQSPVYTPFFNMVEANQRVVENCPLVLNKGYYEIDFEAFEKSLQNGVKLFLLCNPHNPSGRVWTKDELMKIAELCLKYDVQIVSDEIHSDLVFSPHKHVPIASLDKKYENITITLMAPSKTFNLAGLQASFMVIPNKHSRKKIEEAQKRQGFFTLGTFGIAGMEAAYEFGENWLESLLEYVKENIELTKKFITSEIPQLEVVEPEGTYLIWIDCRNTGYDDKEIASRLLEKGKLALEPGPKYGPGGEGFVRMNIACPRNMLLEGLDRLKRSFE